MKSCSRPSTTPEGAGLPPLAVGEARVKASGLANEAHLR